MQKKEIVLTLELLTEKGASEQMLKDFKKQFPNYSATLTEVLRKLQELVSATADYNKKKRDDFKKYSNYLGYVKYVKWLILHFPPTQEPLVLDELTDKVIIHNGDINIKSSIDGDHVIIGNGDLNIEGDLSGRVRIWAAKKVKANNITAFDDSEIWTKIIDAKSIKVLGCVKTRAEVIDAKLFSANCDAEIRVAIVIYSENIDTFGSAKIWAKKIDTIKIKAGDKSMISVNNEIDAKNITAEDHAGIYAEKIDTIKIVADRYAKIGVKKEIDAVNLIANYFAEIKAETINTRNIAGDGGMGILAKIINTQNLADGNRRKIYGKINIIQPPQTIYRR